MRDSGRAYEYKVLTIGPSQVFLRQKAKRKYTLLVWMICMPDSESVEENDMPSTSCRAYFSQSVQQSSIL